jgi:hypothetical protein
LKFQKFFEIFKKKFFSQNLYPNDTGSSKKSFFKIYFSIPQLARVHCELSAVHLDELKSVRAQHQKAIDELNERVNLLTAQMAEQTTEYEVKMKESESARNQVRTKRGETGDTNTKVHYFGHISWKEAINSGRQYAI